MQAVVQTEGLTKRYGNVTAIDGVDIEIDTGQRVAIIGQPQSGKTTLFRLLVNLVHPTAGRARVGGFDTSRGSYQVRRLTGWVPASVSLPRNLAVGEFLDRMAEFKRSDPDVSLRSTVLPALDVGPDDKLRELDDEERHIVALLAAVQKQPDLFLLDEPLAGSGRFRELAAEILGSLSDQVTVMASARDLSLAERMSDRVLLLDNGRIIADGPLSTLRSRVRQRTELEFSSAPNESALRSLPGVLDLVVQGNTARVLSVGSTDKLIDAVRPAGLIDSTVRQPGLEELMTDHRLLADNS
ncbi:MAG: ABC transporter ATP-binding protein [Actinobacteria bacterium]|nr:ABC transporter ATP-binding protein [Actinomycetota bacterium]